MITEAHYKISTLRSIIPDEFLFILDITDRSFLYKSKDCPKSEEYLINLDSCHGLDKLTENSDFYSYEKEEEVIKIQKIHNNTFLGICAPSGIYSEFEWLLVDNCLSNLN